MITDWALYAVSIPAVVLLGLSKSGFGAGFGSLAVPMMALVVSVPQAAAILMPVLFVMDVMALGALRHNLDRQLIKFLLPFGLMGIVVGAALFKLLDAKTVSAIVGAVTLAFLAQRLLFPPRADSAAPPKWLGAVLTVTSGFTSFVAHAGGPPIQFYVIPMRLAPLVFTATMAAFFFVINLAKWLPYAWLGLLDWRNMSTSLALLPFAPMGVWLGVRMARRMSPIIFYRVLYAGMFLSGVKLLWDGLR
ncbi:MAG: sulfite exporter TauE/SafE family protein [Betaproteobacteria bacterium]